MRHSTNNLATLIGSRICHDLISPIGAITNGLELMQMSGAALTPEVALISDSVENANARIRFFRVAYGMATASQSMGRAEIVSILKAVAQGARVSFHWGPLEDLPRTEVRLAFLALQCFETAMPYGGRITLTREGQLWAISCTADKLRQTPELWAHLDSDGTGIEVSPAEVQFALLPVLLAEAERRVSLRITENDILMRF
ncbi:MAG: histidine phosphotransferase family protein [Paracoccaceae bacterium]|nr:histidine phosphotransferase family protein [Paracoccaceae bacterium]